MRAITRNDKIFLEAKICNKLVTPSNSKKAKSVFLGKLSSPKTKGPTAKPKENKDSAEPKITPWSSGRPYLLSKLEITGRPNKVDKANKMIDIQKTVTE